MEKELRVLIAAGGTGGHTLPALTVAEQLKEDKSIKILFVTSTSKMDRRLIFDKGFRSKSIMAGKLRRYFSPKTLMDPLLFLIGFFQSLYLMINFRPKVIFSKGGFVSLPVVLAGFIFRKKIVLHESDLRMGLANKICAKFANKVLVSFRDVEYPDIKPNKLVLTGNPIKNIQVHPKRIDGTTILFMGGSQGARNINQNARAALPDLLKEFYILHLTGPLDFDEYKKLKDDLPGQLAEKYKVFPSVFDDDDFSRLLSDADIVVSRAGASSITEFMLFSKASIIVPLAGHQEANAKYLADKKACLVIKDQELSATNLKDNIFKLAYDKKLREDLEKNIAKLIERDATQKIVNEILVLGQYEI